MSRILVLGFVMLVMLMACKGKEKTSTNTQNSKTLVSDTLILSFLSRGEGPDRQAVPEFRAYQAKTTQELGKNIFSAPKPWGREGEHDIYVVFTGLTKLEQERITRELEEFDTKYDLVVIKVFIKKP